MALFSDFLFAQRLGRQLTPKDWYNVISSKPEPLDAHTQELLWRFGPHQVRFYLVLQPWATDSILEKWAATASLDQLEKWLWTSRPDFRVNEYRVPERAWARLVKAGVLETAATYSNSTATQLKILDYLVSGPSAAQVASNFGGNERLTSETIEKFLDLYPIVLKDSHKSGVTNITTDVTMFYRLLANQALTGEQLDRLVKTYPPLEALLTSHGKILEDAISYNYNFWPSTLRVIFDKILTTLPLHLRPPRQALPRSGDSTIILLRTLISRIEVLGDQALATESLRIIINLDDRVGIDMAFNWHLNWFVPNKEDVSRWLTSPVKEVREYGIRALANLPAPSSPAPPSAEHHLKNLPDTPDSVSVPSTPKR